MLDSMYFSSPLGDAYPESCERLNQVTGVILAGGKNSRMGTNKAFLNVNGRPIIENTISIFKRVFEEVIIITNNPEDYLYPDVSTVKDNIQGRGAMGGLYTGLLKAKNRYCFVSACDMPFIREDMIRYIATFRNWDIVVPLMKGNYEPLFALYSRNCLGAMEAQFSEENLRIFDFYPKVRVKEVTAEELRRFDEGLISLVNINTPEELDSALSMRVNMYNKY